MVVLKVFAAFWAAEKTDEKKPLGDWGGYAVPPGVFASSMCGVSGAVMEFESLLGGFVAERTRRCDIMFPEGDTTTFGFDWDVPCFAPDLKLNVDPVGEGFPSVGVGGVTNVVGVSPALGGVAGIGICVMMRFGALLGRFGVD